VRILVPVFVAIVAIVAIAAIAASALLHWAVFDVEAAERAPGHSL
jgi:hypothetical protein